MDVYLETGNKRTFAGAIDWPGWCRSGKDEASALQALLDYAPRYARLIQPARLGFTLPDGTSAFTIVERLEGNAGTDFGAPSVTPAADAAPVGQAQLEQYRAMLSSLWQTFDAAVQAAEGRELRTGPRGGGRDLEKIIRHVFEADQAYLSRLGGTLTPEQKKAELPQGMAALRQAVLDTLGPAARGELPSTGPRGGRRWGVRFFMRYAAWHLLDHTWEIEDRAG